MMREETVEQLKILFMRKGFAIYVFLTAMDVVSTLTGVMPGLTREMNPLWAWSLPDHPIFFSVARILLGIVLISFFYASPVLNKLYPQGARTQHDRDLMLWFSCIPLFLVVVSNFYQISRALEHN